MSDTPTQETPTREVDVTLPMLPERLAYALAELCKRISWADAQRLAVDDDQARAIINGTDRLRGALEQAGICVR